MNLLNIDVMLEIMKKWVIICLFVAVILLTAPKMFEYQLFRARLLEEETPLERD